MNPNKALWEKGDFARLAQSMRRSGESLISPEFHRENLGSG
jgi:hypothetical protein